MLEANKNSTFKRYVEPKTLKSRVFTAFEAEITYELKLSIVVRHIKSML